MKNIIRSTIFLGLATLALLIFMHIYHSRGEIDATLGVERVYDGWSEDQEEAFDSIREIDADSVFLFDRLGLTKEKLDQRVMNWVNTSLPYGQELPADCFIHYELLEFDQNGVRVQDKNGKWHRAMTYGTEPVAHIFLAGQDPAVDKPHLSYFLRCFNGWGKIKDPTKITKVAVRNVESEVAEEQRYNVLGVINAYHHPCDYVANPYIWLEFARKHEIGALYQDSVWHYCSPDEAEKQLSTGCKIAIDVPAETEVILRTDFIGAAVVVLRYPGNPPTDDKIVTEWNILF